MFVRLIREPMMHFAVIALAIFAIYAVVAPSGATSDDRDITVSRAKIEQLATVFERTWQRPPSPDELKGLIDDHVKEEIDVREAVKLGLDKDDTVIRRRLQQKMEFLTDAGIELTAPPDAELEAYLAAHPEKFAVDPRISLQQVYLNPDRHGDRIEADGAAVLAALVADPEADRANLGDASLLPIEVPLSETNDIAGIFGPEFASEVAAFPTGDWSGPAASAYGLHVVRVMAREAGHVPALPEIRDDVVREWSNARRIDREDARIASLLKTYSVTVESAPEPALSP